LGCYKSNNGEHWLVSTTAYTLHTKWILRRKSVIKSTHVLLWFLGALVSYLLALDGSYKKDQKRYLGIFLEVADDNEEGVLRMCRRDHEMATLSDKVKQTD